jgi:hypothetical protein
LKSRFSIVLFLSLLFLFSASGFLPVSGDVEQSISEDAHQLAKQIIDAYGGPEAIKHGIEAGMRSTGKVIQYSTLSGAANTFDLVMLTKGRKMRIDMEVMGQPLLTAYDGEHSWTKQGDQVIRSSSLSEKSIRDEIDHGLYLLGKLSDDQAKLRIVGTKDALGHSCDLLEITLNDESPTLFYVDRQTHLVLQSEYDGIDTEQGVDTRKIYSYEDYKPFAGSYQPYLITEYCGNQKASVLKVATIEELPIEDTAFMMPVEQASPIAAGSSVTLPFELVFNEILVTAKVNDTQDLSFIVDTGATQSVLDSSIAPKFGEAKQSTFEMTTGSGSVPLSYMTIKSLSLKDIRLNNLAFAVTDLSTFSQIIGRKPAGLLGANVLRQFLITIDYANQQITFANPHDTASLSADAVVLPAKPALGLAGLLLDGNLDGENISLLVDTGAAFNNISEKLAKPILKSAILPVGSIQGLDGRKVPIGAVQFDRFQLGELKATHPVFSVAPEGRAPAGIISSSGLAILGNPFLQHYRLTIDYLNQKIILDRSPAQETFEHLYEELSSIEKSEALSGYSPARADQYRFLSNTAKEKHCDAIEALCMADLSAHAAPPAGLTFQDESARTAITKGFDDADKKAAASGNLKVRAAVLAKSANFYLDNFPRDTAVSVARPILITAAHYCGTEATTYVVTAKLLHTLKNDVVARQLVNQALMIAPANWDALWLKYDLTPADDIASKQLVTAQIEQYYPNAPQLKTHISQPGNQSNNSTAKKLAKPR